jgi:hypothetical protein
MRFLLCSLGELDEVSVFFESIAKLPKFFIVYLYVRTRTNF